jgi:exonuclease SbcC
MAAEHARSIEAAAERRDAVVERTETDILLSRVAEGNNALRIDLATFVLVHRFRSVIEAANHHLMQMSNGRLLLEAFEDAERRNERAGLGIRVRDLHTESVRSTKSLSGGETFYASLSLALGLAEIVTAESGGVELDTLFVDEGFGSLDPDTLDSVMGVLDGLQRNGRVLGLVSHVTEMKERIAERVEVRRVHQTGASTLRVVA